VDDQTLLIVGGAFFLAAFAKGITGLGFSTACLPMLALAIGLKAALPLVIVPSLASNLIVMIESRRFGEAIRRFWRLLLFAIPGIALGLGLLAWLDQRHAALALGLVLAAYALFALRNPHLTLPPGWEKPLAPVTGFLTGVFNGLTGSQVMPVLPYLMALRLDRDLFVQAINCSFTFSSLVMAAGLSKIGLMTWETAAVSAGGLIPVYVGVTLGGFIRRRLDADIFRKLVLLMLLAGGAVLVARGV